MAWVTLAVQQLFIITVGVCLWLSEPNNGADARYRMCKSSGYIRSQTSKYLKGDWDLTGGFSGGPLVEYISGAGYVAIGIHKDGSTIDGSSYPTSYTGALRITQSLYTLFLSYRG